MRAALLVFLLVSAAACSGLGDEPQAPGGDAGADIAWAVSFADPDVRVVEVTAPPDLWQAPELLPVDDTAAIPDLPGPEPDLSAPPPDVVPDVAVPPDTGPPAPLDRDDDGVPDEADRWPDDPDLPGVALLEYVYAQTSDRLFRMDVKTYLLQEMGAFAWPPDGKTHQMTDIAIDRWGALYGVSFDALYTCHPETARCQPLGALPPGNTFNGLTFVPASLFGVPHDVLIGVSREGNWYHLEVSPGPVNVTPLGSYGAFCNSGDVYSVEGLGTFAAAKPDPCAGDDLIVGLQPRDGAVTRTVVRLAGYTQIWGLAGWNQYAFAFDAGGDILAVDVEDATFQVIKKTEHAWWGAGTRTVID